ncbi:MAG: taurine catabolism dioxygenase TauD [Rhodospirillaceae bacterium]|nr:taurine catabolism dioxygenase TauD [Rhodospirillaceae bacterium]
MEIIPTDAALGAEVRGIDATKPITGADKDAVMEAYHKYLVLLFRDQDLDPQQQIDFAQTFGELGMPAQGLLGLGKKPNQPDELPATISCISNIKVDGKAIGNLGNLEAMWHTDSSFVERPPSASVLHGKEVPPDGGDTSFLNMYAALEDMPAELLAEIEDRVCRHSQVHSSNGVKRPEFEEVTDISEAPGPEHPFIRLHVESKRKCLFLGRRLNSYVPGMTTEESEAFLDRLWAHTIQDKFVWSHQWRVGDVLVWDNRCTMHHRTAFDDSKRRRMYKVQIMGEVPVAEERHAA